MPLMTRASGLTHFAEVTQQAGLDPLELMETVGLPAEALTQTDMMLPVDSVNALLELAAARSGWIDFGLRMAEGRKLSNLGPLGLLLREEATLRRALEAVVRYLHTYNQALAFTIDAIPPVVVLREEALIGRGQPVRQGLELSLAVTCRIIRMFMGNQWQPHRVCLAHTAPRSRARHHQAFGPHAEFGHDFNGIVIRERDLDAPNPSADPVMARYARQVLESTRNRRKFSAEVRHLVLLLLPTGSCSAEAVARHFGVDRRTIQRQLGAEQLTFSALVNEIRRELAQRYLAQDRSLEQVGAMLGFAQPSSFSRWYRQEFDHAARDRRRLLGADG